MSYQELSIADRVTIQIGQLHGLSRRAIASLLKRSPSAVRKDLRCNSAPSGGYVAHAVQTQAVERRKPLARTSIA